MLVWGGLNSRLVQGGATEPDGAPGGGRYDPATDTWLTIATEGAGTPSEGTPAIWTGSELLLFGGTRAKFPPGTTAPFLGAMNLYDPTKDSWRRMNDVGAPSRRTGHLVVWSGSEALVWGGSMAQDSGSGLGSGMDPASAGGAYDPARNAWRPITRTQQPMARHGALGVFASGAGSLSTGLMLVVGGPAQGGAYDPASDRWWPLSMQDAPSFGEAVAVWTGKYMLVWGMTSTPTGFVSAGARYEP
jgi:hypothetical protein